MKLAPSILSADLSQLAENVQKIQKGGADYIHVDVMDGHFVPNISFGAPVMKSLMGKTNIPFDVHLMIENPDKYIEDFITENTQYITVHQEASVHLHRTIQKIKSYGVKAGVALNPSTPVENIKWVLADVDMVLIMSVNPGFGGQKFIGNMLDKVKELSELKKAKGYDFLIEIDGGVTIDNWKEVEAAGVDIAVSGSGVFNADDVVKRVKNIKNI